MTQPKPITLTSYYQALADLFNHLGAITITGTVTAWKPTRSRWIRAELAQHHGGKVVAKAQVAISPTVAIKSAAVDIGSQVVMTAIIETSPIYSPMQLVATSIDLLRAPDPVMVQAHTYLDFLRQTGQIDTNRHQAIPTKIRTVGIVGPPSGGAGITDPEAILVDQAPDITVRTYATVTTGPNAPEAVARAVHLASTDNDVVLVCRGGGATTDLAAFNHPAVIEAIIRSPKPVITGIGHAADTTNADAVAHTSTPTPSAAAAHVVTVQRTATSPLGFGP